MEKHKSLMFQEDVPSGCEVSYSDAIVIPYETVNNDDDLVLDFSRKPVHQQTNWPYAHTILDGRFLNRGGTRTNVIRTTLANPTCRTVKNQAGKRKKIRRRNNLPTNEISHSAV